ncbi:hypothetical protein AAY473_001569, partial [Plecturocebus cupreus]
MGLHDVARLVLNSWPQVIHLPRTSTVLELQLVLMLLVSGPHLESEEARSGPHTSANSGPWSCKLPSGQRRLQNNWEESGRREAK